MPKADVLLQETMAQTAQAACALDMSCVSWQTKSSLGGCWIQILSDNPEKYKGKTNKSCMVD